jgi:hypothetical protein
MSTALPVLAGGEALFDFIASEIGPVAEFLAGQQVKK